MTREQCKCCQFNKDNKCEKHGRMTIEYIEYSDVYIHCDCPYYLIATNSIISDDMTKQDFSTVKVGDKVIYTTGSTWYSHTVIEPVVKVTPKQFKTKDGNSFWKKDGTMIGNSWRSAAYATEKDIAEINARDHRREMKTKITNFVSNYNKMESLSTQELETIYNLISKYDN